MDKFLTLQQVSEMLQVSVQALLNWGNEPDPKKRLKIIRLGDKTLRVRESDLEEYLARHTEN
jgi:predicted DNA-binding transcriptional regulator AlpA